MPTSRCCREWSKSFLERMRAEKSPSAWAASKPGWCLEVDAHDRWKLLVLSKEWKSGDLITDETTSPVVRFSPRLQSRLPVRRLAAVQSEQPEGLCFRLLRLLHSHRPLHLSQPGNLPPGHPHSGQWLQRHFLCQWGGLLFNPSLYKTHVLLMVHKC